MFYVEKDKKIVLFNEDKKVIETTLKFMPQYAECEIKETKRPIENFEFADTKSYKAKKQIADLQAEIDELEKQYGMNRWQREIILAEKSVASDYAKSKAQEIEDKAVQLRELQK